MTRNHVGRRWSYHPFLLPCGSRYTNVVYNIGNSADTFVGLSSQDNSRRPPLRLEWRERTSIEESDDGVEDRGVARAGGRPTHTSAHFHTCRGTHTHSHAHTHARIWVTTDRPGVQIPDLIYVHDLQLVASWRFYKQDSVPSPPPSLATSRLRFRWCGFWAVGKYHWHNQSTSRKG